MKILNIVNGLTELQKDLTNKKKVLIEMKINGIFEHFFISNYYASYQTQATDLILIENKEFNFVVNSNLISETVSQQIRTEFNK